MLPSSIQHIHYRKLILGHKNTVQTNAVFQFMTLVRPFMTTQKNRLIKRGIAFLLIGLTIVIVYLYFFVGLSDFAEAAQRTNPFYYSLAVMALFLSTAFYSLAWQSILGLLQVKIAFRKTISFVFVGSFVDLMIPAESFSGEISKIYLMSKNSGDDLGKVAASVVSHRILAIATTLVGVIIGSTFLLLGFETSQIVVNLMLFVAACTIGALILITYLSLSPQATQKIADWAVRFLSFVSRGRWELTKFKLELTKALEAFHQGMSVLKEQPKSLVTPFVFSVVAFLFDLLISFLVFMSLDFPVSLSLVLVVSTIVGAIQTIPLGIPGEIGLTEVVMTSLYVGFGIPAPVSAASTVLTRVLTVWIRILIGYIAVQWMGITVLTGPQAFKISWKKDTP